MWVSVCVCLVTKMNLQIFLLLFSVSLVYERCGVCLTRPGSNLKHKIPLYLASLQQQSHFRSAPGSEIHGAELGSDSVFHMKSIIESVTGLEILSTVRKKEAALI